MKALRLIIIILLAFCGEAFAVLPEENVDVTVRMLHKDLEVVKEDLDNQQNRYETLLEEFQKKGDAMEGDLDMASLVLHSQNDNWIFGMAQATQMARDEVEKFRHRDEGIERWHRKLDNSIQRVRNIKKELSAINLNNLTPEGKKSREASLALCNEIEKQYAGFRELIQPEVERHKKIERQAAQLSAQTYKTLDQLYTAIFVVPEESYGQMLEHLDERGERMLRDLSNSFVKGQNAETDWKEQEESYSIWDDITMGCAVALAVLAWFWCRRKKEKQIFSLYSLSWALVVLFAANIVGDLLMIWLAEQPVHIQNSIWINIQLDVLITLLLLSNIASGTPMRLYSLFMLYGPLLLLVYFCIQCITKLVPLSFIIFFQPLVYILYIAVSAVILLILRKKANKNSLWFNMANIVYVCFCLAVACKGWYVASMIMFLAWISLWCIMLAVYLAKTVIERYAAKRGSTFFSYTMKVLVFPCMVIFAFLGSGYWVASIFNLTSWYVEWLSLPVVDLPNVMTLSVGSLISVILLGLCINYVLKTTKMLLIRRNAQKYGSGKEAVWISLGTILTWMGYMVAVIVILKINHAGIIAAIGGASVGLGFALRDTFENFFFGLTMMAGRARPGDIVECDGIRGVVMDVGIISTTIRTEDEPIVSLPNRQLFGRNFANLTRNGGKEVRHIIFDIDAGSDIEKARSLMLEASFGIDGVVDFQKHYVVMRHTSCGIVRLDYKCWIDSSSYLRAEPAVREAIFHAFKENGIQIAEFTNSLDMRASAKILENKDNIVTG